jgi:serine/threonine-protein kinase
LSPAELRRIDRVPTADLDAYDFWVRAFHQINEQGNDEAALALLDHAIEIDPAFAAAYSLKAVALSSLFWGTGRTEQELCDEAAEALEVARSISPDLFDLRVDAGWYHYRCHLDYERALASIDTALQIAPSSVEALEVYGNILRRAGRVRESIDAHLRAVELSPRYGDLHWHLKSSYALLRMPGEAERHAERAIALVPSKEYYYTDAAWVYYRLSGDTEKAREVLERGRAAGVEALRMTAWDSWLALLEGKPDLAAEMANAIPRDALLPSFVWYPPYRSRFHFLAAAYRLSGDRQAELAYLDSASVVLTTALEESEEPYLRSSLGVVFAELGRREDAIREGEHAVHLLPLEKDAWGGTYLLENLAQIYVITGEYEAAVDVLERLLTIPGDLTAAYLERNPTWEPLRENPRFQALLGGRVSTSD